MDQDRFDSLTRALGVGRSRRSVVKGVGAAILGAVGLSQFGAAEAASNKNSACAQFCAAVFGVDTTAAGQCTRQGAHGFGPCLACGNNPANYCNGSCVANYSADVNNCGGCGNVCSGGDACNAPICRGGGCTTAPTNEGGSCNGGAGTCSSGVCQPLDPCAGMDCSNTGNECVIGYCYQGACYSYINGTGSCNNGTGTCDDNGNCVANPGSCPAGTTSDGAGSCACTSGVVCNGTCCVPPAVDADNPVTCSGAPEQCTCHFSLFTGNGWVLQPYFC